MPLQFRTEDEITVDVLRDLAAASQGRLTDGNIGALLSVLIEEGFSPEMAQQYHANYETWESALINKAQGPDLDKRIQDWKFADAENPIVRAGAVAASGFGAFFGPKADAGKATSATSSTLVDSTKSWTTNAYAGKMVRIIAGTAVGQERKIVSNTGTTLTIEVASPWSGWSPVPTAGDKYEIISLATADTDVPLGTIVYAQGPTLSDRLRFKTTVTPASKLASTATGGSIAVPGTPTLVDAAQAWTTNEHVGRMVIIRAGTGAGQLGVVKSNTSNTLTIRPLFPFVTWTSAPTGTSIYEILEGRLPVGGAVAPIPVVATATGDAHNIVKYSMTNFEAGAPANIGSVWNTNSEAMPAAFTSGRKIEADTEYRERFRAKLRSLPRCTPMAIKALIKDYTQEDGSKPVKSVSIDENVYPAKVYIEDGNGTAPGALVTTIQDLLNGTGVFTGKQPLRPSGYPHTSVSGAAVAVNVALTIASINDGYTFAGTKADIEQRVRMFFSSQHQPISKKVVYSDFLAAVDAPGVTNFSTATLNGATSDISMAINQKAILGTVSIS